MTVQIEARRYEQETAVEGIITNIQRFSIHDGPGIRTTLFLKGCNLRCFWCHNPEAMRPQPEIQFFADHCIFCGACLEACAHGAHQVAGDAHQYLRERCQACGDCVDTCYAGGLVLVGKRMSVEDVVAEVLADQAFYTSSGGGVTLSGGEPLLQLEFAQAVLGRCQQEGVHTAIETAANLPWSRIEAILPYVDLVMMDVKMMDSERHRRATGVPNERILANAEKLGRQPQPLIVRTPVIPGVNDNVAAIDAVAAFVAKRPNLLYYELLPYHPMAKSKYRSLDLAYGADELAPPPKELLGELADAARAHGIEVRVA